MKTRLAILVALAATAGVSTGAFADLAPGNPGASLGPGAAPVLFPSEQGAFKALEVATQLVESSILQNGCDTTEYDLSVKTNKNGKGYAKLGDLKNNPVNLTVALKYAGYEGRQYTVTGSGYLGDLAIGSVDAIGSYNIGSGIQELTTTWTASSPTSDDLDKFRGTIIKDYWRLTAKQAIPEGFTNAKKAVNTAIDYGYQQIQKHDIVAAKYWQQSQTWRQNGVRPGTWWKKVRVAPENDCTIEVRIQGTTGVANSDNINGFNEVGTISVTDGVVLAPGEEFYAK